MSIKALREGVRLRKRGRGRPRRRPRGVEGEGADDAEAIRAAVRGGGIRAGIRENRRGRKKARKGRPRRFDEKADPAIRRSVAEGRVSAAFLQDTSDFSPRFKASSTLPAPSLLGEF